jgi:hypothetical protein
VVATQQEYPQLARASHRGALIVNEDLAAEVSGRQAVSVLVIAGRQVWTP